MSRVVTYLERCTEAITQTWDIAVTRSIETEADKIVSDTMARQHRRLEMSRRDTSDAREADARARRPVYSHAALLHQLNRLDLDPFDTPVQRLVTRAMETNDQSLRVNYELLHQFSAAWEQYKRILFAGNVVYIDERRAIQGDRYERLRDRLRFDDLLSNEYWHRAAASMGITKTQNELAGIKILLPEQTARRELVFVDHPIDALDDGGSDEQVKSGDRDGSREVIVDELELRRTSTVQTRRQFAQVDVEGRAGVRRWADVVFRKVIDEVVGARVESLSSAIETAVSVLEPAAIRIHAFTSSPGILQPDLDAIHSIYRGQLGHSGDMKAMTQRAFESNIRSIHSLLDGRPAITLTHALGMIAEAINTCRVLANSGTGNDAKRGGDDDESKGPAAPPATASNWADEAYALVAFVGITYHIDGCINTDAAESAVALRDPPRRGSPFNQVLKEVYTISEEMTRIARDHRDVIGDMKKGMVRIRKDVVVPAREAYDRLIRRAVSLDVADTLTNLTELIKQTRWASRNDNLSTLERARLLQIIKDSEFRQPDRVGGIEHANEAKFYKDFAIAVNSCWQETQRQKAEFEVTGSLIRRIKPDPTDRKSLVVMSADAVFGCGMLAPRIRQLAKKLRKRSKKLQEIQTRTHTTRAHWEEDYRSYSMKDWSRLVIHRTDLQPLIEWWSTVADAPSPSLPSSSLSSSSASASSSFRSTSLASLASTPPPPPVSKRKGVNLAAKTLESGDANPADVILELFSRRTDDGGPRLPTMFELLRESHTMAALCAYQDLQRATVPVPIGT